MDCDNDVGEAMEAETANLNDHEGEMEAKSFEEGRESKAMDEDPQRPAVVINAGTDTGWRYWCHQCNEVLETIPVIRDDGSIECTKCKENVVEKIAEDDDFLQEEAEEKVVEIPRQAQVGGNPVEFLRSIGMPENFVQQISGNGQQRDIQWHVQRANNSAQPVVQNPISAFFREIEGSRGAGLNRFVRQFDRLFMGGAPGSPVNAEQAFQGLNLGALFGFGPTGSFGGQQLNPSDYGIGFNGLRDILSRLQREGGPSGPPPASKRIVAQLKEVEFSTENKDQETACAVCKDDFKDGDKVIQFPCPNKHLYHGRCIQPWLKLHNSCPVCRFELPTDDELYERMKQIRQNMMPDNNTNNNNDPAPTGPSG